MEQRFIIPGRLPGYNELKDGHWGKRATVKKSGMDTVMWCAKAAGINPVDGKAIITVSCYEKDCRRDEDNVLFGAHKIILDALQQAGIIKGDGRKYVKLDLQPVQIDRDNPRVEVVIKPEGAQ